MQTSAPSTHQTQGSPSDTPTHAHEDLLALSKLAYAQAPTLCAAEHGCGDYHKMWSVVRLLESQGALPSGLPFFCREIPKAAREGRVNIVLSGAADTGLLAIAHEAAARAQLQAHITMVERCATPLAQGAQYAAQNDIGFTPVHGVFGEIAVENADAILAHSFLVFIPDDQKLDLLTHWAQALRPGGKVIMSQRLVPQGQSYKRIRPPEQLAEREDALRAQLEADNPFDIDIPTLLDAAHALWMTQMGGFGLSESQLREISAQAGLDVERIDYDEGLSSVSPFAIGKQARKRPRGEIVLRKPL